MLNGVKVENMVIGGPAYNCQQLTKGDEIVSVDGTSVTKDTVLRALIGSDQPGSSVRIKVEKADGSESEIMLRRMSSERIADRRRMFEWFTKMKMCAEIDGDKPLAESIDKCIELWTNMLIADASHNRQVADNVRNQQKINQDYVEKLAVLLKSIAVEWAQSEQAFLKV